MGGKPSSNSSDPLPESSPVPWTIFTTGTRFSSSVSSQTLPNLLLALTKKIDQYFIQNSSKCEFETAGIYAAIFESPAETSAKFRK